MRFLLFALIVTLAACQPAALEKTAARASLKPAPLPAESMLPIERTVQLTTTLEVDSKDARLVRKKGRYWFGAELFEGFMVASHPDGSRARRTPYARGRKNGWEHSWFANGQLREQRCFVDGLQDGVQRGWWMDGSPRFHFRYRSGSYHGEQRSWHENPSTESPSPENTGLENNRYASFQNYIDGREEGQQRSWSTTGKLLANYVVKNGRHFGVQGARPCYTVTRPSDADSLAENDPSAGNDALGERGSP